MESVFTGNVSLYLRLVDTVDGGPCESPSNDNCPECVSLQRVRIKTEWKGEESKYKLFARDQRQPS